MARAFELQNKRLSGEMKTILSLCEELVRPLQEYSVMLLDLPFKTMWTKMGRTQKCVSK